MAWSKASEFLSKRRRRRALLAAKDTLNTASQSAINAMDAAKPEDLSFLMYFGLKFVVRRGFCTEVLCEWARQGPCIMRDWSIMKEPYSQKSIGPPREVRSSEKSEV